jgi:hypothetical protein
MPGFKDVAEDFVARRMANTGETRADAAAHVVAFLTQFAARDATKDVQHEDGSMSFELPQ